MPFESKAQQRFLYAKHPEVAREFSSHMTPEDYKKLPDKKHERGLRAMAKLAGEKNGR